MASAKIPIMHNPKVRIGVSPFARYIRRGKRMKR
jgi:hypothetical protein